MRQDGERKKARERETEIQWRGGEEEEEEEEEAGRAGGRSTVRERADDRRRRRRRRVTSLFSSLSVDVSPKSNTGSCLARMRMLLILLCSSLLWPTPLIHGVG